MEKKSESSSHNYGYGESQRDYFSDSDSDALARVAFGEGENSQQFGGLSFDADGVIKGRASNVVQRHRRTSGEPSILD